MSPRTEKQFEEIRQEKTTLIKEAALKLFAENGFKSTTINTIAKEAGISKGLLYNYFESKEVLLETILNDGLQTMLSIFDPDHNGYLEKSEMEFFIREIMKKIKQNPEFWKLYWSVSFQPDAFRLITQKTNDMVQPMTKMMVDYFERSGFKNATTESMIFGALMDGVVLAFILKPDVYPIDLVTEEIIVRYCK